MLLKQRATSNGRKATPNNQQLIVGRLLSFVNLDCSSSACHLLRCVVCIRIRACYGSIDRYVYLRNIMHSKKGKAFKEDSVAFTTQCGLLLSTIERFSLLAWQIAWVPSVTSALSGSKQPLWPLQTQHRAFLALRENYQNRVNIKYFVPGSSR